MLKKVFAATILVTICSATAVAAYTRASSSPVRIASIYSNEYGSPFLTFTSTVNSACTGMYLYNITASGTPQHLLNNKMAIALAAAAADKQVVLDYYYDPTITGWSACYIHGIQIVN